MFASNAMVSKGDGDEEERREGEIYIYIYTEREKEKRKRRGENGAEEKTKRRGTKEQQPGGTCAMCLRTRRRPRRGKEGGERARPRPTKSEARREKIELNWGQIDSSRESLHSIWRLPNRVRLTPFKTFNGPSWKVLKDARVEPS